MTRSGLLLQIMRMLVVARNCNSGGVVVRLAAMGQQNAAYIRYNFADSASLTFSHCNRQQIVYFLSIVSAADTRIL